MFVARDIPENPFKAFVFACESKTKAREAFKALSLAFIINYECYQASLARGSSLDNHELKDNAFFDGGVSEAGHGIKPSEGRWLKREQAQHCYQADGVHHGDNSFFNGMPEAEYEIRSAEGSSGKGSMCLFNSAIPLQTGGVRLVMRNGFLSSRDKASTITPSHSMLAPNQALLQVPKCSARAKSVPDPTAQFGKTTALAVPAAPIPSVSRIYVTCLSVPHIKVDAESEEEFTEFAKHRMRSSSTTIPGDCHESQMGGLALRTVVPAVIH